MTQPFLIAPPGAVWIPVKDGYPPAVVMVRTHYSRKVNTGRGVGPASREKQQGLIVGPGEKLVLVTPCGRAVLAWRKEKFQLNDQRGVNCCIFVNRGAGVASELIKAADDIAWRRWPGERLYTYVNDRMVRKSRTPGRCFLKAGWRYVLDGDGKRKRTSERNLLILEISPPEAENPR